MCLPVSWAAWPVQRKVSSVPASVQLNDPEGITDDSQRHGPSRRWSRCGTERPWSVDTEEDVDPEVGRTPLLPRLILRAPAHRHCETGHHTCCRHRRHSSDSARAGNRRSKANSSHYSSVPASGEVLRGLRLSVQLLVKDYLGVRATAGVTIGYEVEPDRGRYSAIQQNPVLVLPQVSQSDGSFSR
jgi:hypothetical protein